MNHMIFMFHGFGGPKVAFTLLRIAYLVVKIRFRFLSCCPKWLRKFTFFSMDVIFLPLATYVVRCFSLQTILQLAKTTKI